LGRFLRGRPFESIPASLAACELKIAPGEKVDLNFASRFYKMYMVDVPATCSKSSAVESGRTMRSKTRAISRAALAAVFLALAGAGPYTAGQKVEVREGDAWSAATVTGVEGRRYHIHYDGADASADEWVESDRVRTPGAATPAAAATTKPAKLANADFQRGDKIETKWGGLWRKSAVFKKSGEWTMVCYDGVFYEWVEPWRLRKIGDTTDVANAQPRANCDKTAAAPLTPPTPQGETGTPVPMVTHHPNPRAHPAAEPAAPATPEVTGGPKDATDVNGQMNPNAGPGDLPLVRPDLSAGKDIEPTSPVGAKTVDTRTAASSPKMISLNHGTPQFGVRSEMLVNPQGKAALLAFEANGRANPVSIQRIDLAGQDSDKVLPLCSGVWPIALSLDGKRLVTRSDRNFEQRSRWRLDLWTLDSSAVKPLFSFRPYDPADNGSDGVNWAHYLDATHMLTCSAGHLVTLWEVSDTGVREIYSLQGDNTVEPEVTGEGRLLAVGFGGKLCVCDSFSGQCLVRSAVPPAGKDMRVSIRPDLKKIALLGHQRLIVMDIAEEIDPATVLNLGLPENTNSRSIDWVKPNLLLIGKQWLYDTDKNTIVWQYEIGRGAEPVAAFIGDRLWFMSESRANSPDGAGHGLFTSMVLPDTPTMIADKKAADGEFLLKPGGSVALQVNINGTGDERQRIIDRLTAQLQEANITISDSAPMKLVAETKNGDTRTQTYRPMGFSQNPNQTETVSATTTIYSLSYMVDGKPVWSTTSQSGGYLPMFIYHKKDQSAADVINEQNKPKLDFFFNATVPTSILKPQPPETIGNSPLGVTSGRTRNRK
jgi:hypothetical protein